MGRTLALFFAAGVLIARPAAAAPSEPPSEAGAASVVSAVFRDDGRLRKQVSVSVQDRPLQEVLTGLGRQFSLRLTAGPDTADDKVTLLVEQRPAAEVLSRLASHFQFRWRRTGRGYELGQDGSEKAREASLREADRAAEWAEYAAWIDRLHRLGATGATTLNQRIAEIDRLLKGSDLDPEGRKRLTEEVAAIRVALRPETVAAVALLRSLTPVQVQRLQKDGGLLLSAERGSLSTEIGERIQKIPANEEIFERPQDVPEVSVYVDAAVGYTEGGHGGHRPRPGERRANLGMELILWREMDGKRQWGGVPWTPLLPARELPAREATRTVDAALNRPVTLDLSRTPRPGRPADGKGESVLTHARGDWPAWPTLGAVAGALRQATGLEILADSFVRGRVDPKWVAERQTVAGLLDTLARELGYTWRKEGNLLLLRSRTAHWDRAMEAPERVLRPWQERAARAEARPIDLFAELAAALDDLQTLGMSFYWGWYLEAPWVAPPGGSAFTLHETRRHLRFWATLTAAQRQAALAGDLLPTAPMSDLQRRAFVTALTDPAAAPWEPAAAFLASGRVPTPNEVLAGSFSLKIGVEWNHQLFEGEKAGEERMRIVALYPTYRPPNLANLPKEYRWSLVGPPSAREDHNFQYHLAREEKPARTATLGILRASPERATGMGAGLKADP